MMVKTSQSLLAIKLLLISLLFNTAIATDTSQAHKDILQAADKKTTGEYVRQRFLDNLKKPFVADDPRKKMLVIGDSHAQDFYNALVENGVDQRYQISTRRIPAICGVYLGSENINHLIKKKHLPNCQKSDTLAEAMPQIKQADVVILAANWKFWSAQRLPTTIENLQI